MWKNDIAHHGKSVVGNIVYGRNVMAEIPEGCPIRDILAQIKLVLVLLDKILEHCDKCLQERKEENDV